MNVFIIVAHPEAKSFNFITQKDTRIFKQQIEEIHATEFGGFSILAPHIVYGPARKSDEERSRILDSYAARLRKIEAESPCDVGSY